MPENLPPNSAAPIPLALPLPIPGFGEASAEKVPSLFLEGTVPLLLYESLFFITLIFLAIFLPVLIYLTQTYINQF
jgi:hypothetical protein